MPTYLPGAEPFWFEGNSIGCLLVHGFTGTPAEMRGLGVMLSEQFHYTVSGPALAGHATDPDDCARTEWRDWYNSVDEAYRELSARCDQVFAVGLSLGAVLCLHLAAHRKLAGLVSVSAPAYLAHPLETWFRRFPFLFRLVPYVAKNDANDDTQDPTVRDAHPGYDRTPTLAARSLVIELLPHVRQHLSQIQTPALLLQGRQDRTIPPDSMSIIFNELGSTDKEAVWVQPSGHLVLEDYAKGEAFGRIATFIEQHIYQASIVEK